MNWGAGEAGAAEEAMISDQSPVVSHPVLMHWGHSLFADDYSLSGDDSLLTGDYSLMTGGCIHHSTLSYW